ncbi:MAG TPA: zinc-dependent alcohol dehydrogenase family protein [Candidatus Lokiarchaeia archaeon]|nr:zinc-dependent alcohol dehydrogenase family protein [Candidatus Lokiarchaeia archaeon]
MVLHAPGAIETSPLILEDVPVPEPGTGDVRIRVSTCGACHTDLHEVEGDLLPRGLPRIPGHEIIGTIDELGDDNEIFVKGERVGVSWLHVTCGICHYCTSGLENLCDSATFTGYDVDGGYAEYAIVPGSFAFRIPDAFTDAAAAPLMCAGIIGYRSLRLSGVKPGDRLGLFGFGASAHIAIQVALSWGCEIFVFTRSKEHQEHAKSLGASWAGTVDDEPPAKVQSGISFAPLGSVVLDALRFIDKGGTLAINAVSLTDIPPIPWELLYHERKITSVANVTRGDAVEFLAMAEKIHVETSITTYPLEEANQALLDMKLSNINGAAVLVIR